MKCLPQLLAAAVHLRKYIRSQTIMCADTFGQLQQQFFSELGRGYVPHAFELELVRELRANHDW